jgi:hypothetical protein
MDRNEKYRQKLYAQSKEKPKRDAFTISGGFDPNPYVDVIMESMMDEMEDLEEGETPEFFLNLDKNPHFDIILGKSSMLSLTQKSLVVTRLKERMLLAQSFDPTPYVDELIELFDNKQFDQFKKFDDEGDFVYNFNDYYKDENFTKEQFTLIKSGFHKKQSGKAKMFSRKLIPLFIFCVLLVIIPPFFIPNFLQRMGWLSVDAGWFLKIGVGILSLIMIFLLVKKLFLMYIDSMFKSKKNK